LPSTYGSFAVDQRLSAQNISHDFYTGVGKGHEYWGTTNGAFTNVTADYQDIIQKTALFLYKLLPATPTLKLKLSLSNMSGDLTSLSNFPLSDPYASPPLNARFTHVNNPVVATTTPAVLLGSGGGNAIVDWVFIELRSGSSGSSSVAFTKSALLQMDGDLVDMDGMSPVKFTSAPSGNYFIAIRHRNHLGFRTASKYALSGQPTAIDFGSGVSLHGSSPLGAGNTMIGGDANSDGSVDAIDSVVWETQNGLFDDYSRNADYTMDGSVDSIDSITWELNNGKYEELD